MAEEKPFVWHDGDNYKKVRKKILIRVFIALAFALGLYLFCLYALAVNEKDAVGEEAVSIRGLIASNLYSDFLHQAVIFSSMGAVLLFLILLVAVWHRVVSDGATFILHAGRLYRLTDANRGLTRMAADREGEHPWFEKDFDRAVRSGGCWEILEVKGISEKKKSVRITCRVSRGRKQQKEERCFDIFSGYPDSDRLLEELRSRQTN